MICYLRLPVALMFLTLSPPHVTRIQKVQENGPDGLFRPTGVYPRSTLRLH